MKKSIIDLFGYNQNGLIYIDRSIYTKSVSVLNDMSRIIETLRVNDCSALARSLKKTQKEYNKVISKYLNFMYKKRGGKYGQINY